MANPAAIRLKVHGETQMSSVGARLARMLLPGDLLLLRGDLGAGKTTITRGIVGGLGSPSAVSSPTFALIHVYEAGRMPVVHVDAYRLSSEADLQTTGLDDYLNEGDAVVIIEWPERIENALPEIRLDIAIEEAGDEARELTFSFLGTRWEAAIEIIRGAIRTC